MNSRFLTVALILTIAIAALAQTKPPSVAAQGRPSSSRAGLITQQQREKEFALTPAQQKRIRAVYAKYAPKFTAAFSAGKGKKPDMRRLRLIIQAENREVEAIYTARQRALMKKWQTGR